MLKKAGIVVLGAAAGMGVFVPLASAGTAPDSAPSGHEHSSDGGHGRDHGHGHPRGGGSSCDDIAAAGESSGVVNAPNALSNLDLTHVNILANDGSDDGCAGGGDKAAVAGPSSGVVNAPNLLANPTISHLNVLASDTSGE